MILIKAAIFFYLILKFGFLQALAIFLVVHVFIELFKSIATFPLETRYHVYTLKGYNRGVAVFHPISDHFFLLPARFKAAMLEAQAGLPYFVDKPVKVLLSEK